MASPVINGVATMMLVAGDDAGAKEAVLALARDLDVDAVDAGPLKNARYLESVAMTWIWLSAFGGLGCTFGFASAPRDGACAPDVSGARGAVSVGGGG